MVESCSGFMWLLLMIWNCAISDALNGDRAPEIKKCQGNLTFRTSTFLNWNMSVYANSTGHSQIDCVEKCFQRFQFCKSTKFSPGHQLCLYSYKSSQACAGYNSTSRRINIAQLTMKENGVACCIECEGDVKSLRINNTPISVTSKRSKLTRQNHPNSGLLLDASSEEGSSSRETLAFSTNSNTEKAGNVTTWTWTTSIPTRQHLITDTDNINAISIFKPIKSDPASSMSLKRSEIDDGPDEQNISKRNEYEDQTTRRISVDPIESENGSTLSTVVPRRYAPAPVTVLSSRLHLRPSDDEKMRDGSGNCSRLALLPCSLRFGRGCQFRETKRGCKICKCPYKSAAIGCAGPERLHSADLSEHREMLIGHKKCPNGRSPQRVIRFYRKVSQDGDDCYPVQDVYCGWDTDMKMGRMPRSKMECYFYCFSDEEMKTFHIPFYQ